MSNKWNVRTGNIEDIEDIRILTSEEKPSFVVNVSHSGRYIPVDLMLYFNLEANLLDEMDQDSDQLYDLSN